VSKAIDKKLGAEREVVGLGKSGTTAIWSEDGSMGSFNITAPATEQAKAWQGWGTALKPAYEPIILARKPLAGTVADNVLTHGVGGLNIDGCRVETNRELTRLNHNAGWWSKKEKAHITGSDKGLWPANILLDNALQDPLIKRYFYCAKPSPAEREAGLDELQLKAFSYGNGGKAAIKRNEDYQAKQNANGLISIKHKRNTHPTVKPITLMRYLCRLITPKGGTILEPFAGSGTTLIASHLEGFKHIGIEREADYVKIIRARLRHWAGVRDPIETQKASAQGQLRLFS
jgi:site-specific DNA-methyltransferase (adenine-specific)